MSTESIYAGSTKISRAIGSDRGQLFLQELLTAMDALERPRLVGMVLECNPDPVDGYCDVCALGSVGRLRGIDMLSDERLSTDLQEMFGISLGMLFAVTDTNDSYPLEETPEQRFTRVRSWVESEIDS